MAGRILLIEDDDRLADYIAKGLAEQSFTVDRAANGRDAGGIVAGKTHLAGQGGLVHLDLVAQSLQATDAAAKGRFVTHCTGGRKNVNVGHESLS